MQSLSHDSLISDAPEVSVVGGSTVDPGLKAPVQPRQWELQDKACSKILLS